MCSSISQHPPILPLTQRYSVKELPNAPDRQDKMKEVRHVLIKNDICVMESAGSGPEVPLPMSMLGASEAEGCARIWASAQA